MLAVTVRTDAGGSRLVIEEHAEPIAGPDEAIVAVKAVSLNNGGIRGAFSAPPGQRPGWDPAH